MDLKILNIIEGTTVDGPGFRTSIYFAGCDHQCQGCHNPQTWDINNGYNISIENLIQQVIDIGFDVTLSGGDPFFQYKAVGKLCEQLKNLGFDIWVYTGYIYENIAHLSKFQNILNNIDVLVDGPFIEKKKDIDLRFRGSSNQRLIDVKKTKINNGKIVLWESNF